MNATENPFDPRKYYRLATALMWLALPANALLYAVWWKHLPTQLATHFDFNNRPNGWMSRDGSVIFSMVFALIVVTTATWVLSRIRKPDPAAWALMLLFYVVVGTLLWAEDSVIAYSVSGRPVNVAPVLASGIGAAVFV